MSSLALQSGLSASVLFTISPK